MPQSVIDQSVLRILRTMFRIGVFDTDYTPTAIPVAQDGAAARKVEAEGIALLKNSGGVLPLTQRDHTIALIGADTSVVTEPTGAARVDPTYSVSVLDGLQHRRHKMAPASSISTATIPSTGRTGSRPRT